MVIKLKYEYWILLNGRKYNGFGSYKSIDFEYIF